MAMMWRILVAALVLGILGCFPVAAEDPEKQRQEQAFVAAVGRSPSPGKINDAGKTDLHIVAKMNLPMLAISLLKQGANVNAKTNKGSTPLHFAAVAAASATAEVLLKQGANVNAKTNKGSTPLHFAAVAAASATAEVLLKQGANVNARDNEGYTPLHTAAFWDASATAEVLLKAREPMSNAKTNKGFTPLHAAAVRRMLLRPPRFCSRQGSRCQRQRQ